MSQYQTGIPPQLQTLINSSIEPPVLTRPQELPFDKLTWENFEKLCLRIVQLEATVEGYCQLYGERGDEQAGIDLYARKHLESNYTVYQCKRVKNFSAANIASAVDKFLQGDWANRGKTFVLCTSESLVLKQRADAVIEQRERLLQQSVELVIWDKPKLSSKLKELPELVSDFFGDAWTKAFCGQLADNSLDTQGITEQYLNWLTDTTSSFIVPGLGKELSIETAWILLKAKAIEKFQFESSKQTIKDEIAKYHQGARQRENEELTIDVDNLDLFADKTIFKGRSGTGKSTVLKRLAHLLSKYGKKVLFIRLSKVAKYFASGVTFEEAVLIEAVDSSGIDRQSLKRILSNPDYLLADGLDECSSQQALIAQKLVEWSRGHSQTRIILTSRPFSYDRAYFPEWQDFEILSLKSTETEENAKLLLKALFDNETKVEEELNRFVKRIKVSNIASVAAQNPLLLGFLLQLSIEGIDLAQSRADLYQSIIALAYRQSPPDREFKIELDEPIACRVLDLIGWHLQQSPDLSKQDLVKNIGKEITEELNLKYLVAQQQAQKNIDFWQERRIIELFKIGNYEYVTFAHLSIQEYTAGNYAASLDKNHLSKWIGNVRRQPRYKETILFAASAGAAREICEYLLDLDDDSDPTSIEAVLAAEVLIESEQQSNDLAECIVEKLKPRLKSDIPFIVFEGAEKLLGLVPLARDTIGSLAYSMLKSQKFLIYFTGIRLALECGLNYVDLKRLTDILNHLADREIESRGSLQWQFHNQIIPLGIKLLLEHKPDSKTDKCIENIKQQKHFSFGASQAIDKILMDYGLKYFRNCQTHRAVSQIGKLFEEQIAKLNIKELSSEQLITSWNNSDKESALALLESIFRINNNNTIKIPAVLRSPLSTLAKLFSGMQWGEQTIPAWNILGERIDTDVVDTVVAGAIIALRINLQQIAREASEALNKIREIEKAESNSFRIGLTAMDIFYSTPNQAHCSPSWELAKDSNLSPDLLIRALKHPSDGIRWNAVCLLAHGAGGDKAPQLIENMLIEENEENVLWAISNVAPNICGEKVLEVFLDKLEKSLTEESCYFIKRLPKICQHYNIHNKSRIFSVMLTALNTKNHKIAACAAEALSEFEVSEIEELSSQIKKAFSANPQSKLVSVLVKLKLLSAEELLELYKGSVQGEVTDSLVEMTANNQELLISLLEKIYMGEHLSEIDKYKSGILTKLLTLPSSILVAVKAELIKLCSSNSAIVKEIMFENLSNSQWLDKQEAICLLKNALTDDDISIRNQAVTTLRSIKNVDL